MIASWHLITGEYPPQSGGVSDYTATLAHALAHAGREVHVWTSSPGDGNGGGVIVHRLPAPFDGTALRALDAGLDATTTPRVVLVQYVPQAFGMRGMNVGFCRWVRRRGPASGDDVRIMFHEPYFPFVVWPLHRNLLAIANRVMAALVMSTARRAYVSTTAWGHRLRRYAPSSLPFVWLPIPSAIPALNDTERVAATRRRLAPDSASHVVAHFGTYGAVNRRVLLPTLMLLLRRRPDARICLLGSGSDALAREMESREPDCRGRVIGLGHQRPVELAASLRACDVALQPYPDGASGRRTTLMAALANGVAVVTNAGVATEDVWRSEGGVALVDSASPALLTEAIGALLDDDTRRADVASRGRLLYARCFAIEHTVELLLAPEGDRR